jgi:hypothetical protein
MMVSALLRETVAEALRRRTQFVAVERKGVGRVWVVQTVSCLTYTQIKNCFLGERGSVVVEAL